MAALVMSLALVSFYHAAMPRAALPRTCTCVMDASSAGNRLYEDMLAATSRRSESERQMLEPRMKEMTLPKPARAASQGGFGGAAKPAKKGAKSKAAAGRTAKAKPLAATGDKLHEARVEALKTDGVVLMKNALSVETATRLRACIMDEIDDSRAAVLDAAEGEVRDAVSISRFHVPVEQPTRAFTLLPIREGRDNAAADAPDDGSMVATMRELLAEGAPLGNLFARMCDGDDSQLYDWYALALSLSMTLTSSLSYLRPARATDPPEPTSLRDVVHFSLPPLVTCALPPTSLSDECIPPYLPW